MKASVRADWALVFNVFVWGSTFVVVKRALDDISVVLFLALRFTLATAALAILLRRQILGTRRDVRGGVIAGVCLITGFLLQTEGLRLTTASKSGFLTGLNVVMVPLLSSLVYKVELGWREWLGVGLATVGMGLMTLDASALSINRGDLLTIACAVAFAFHPIVISRFAAGSTATVSFVQIATGAVAAWMLLPILERPAVRWTPESIGALVVTGVLATAVVFSLQTWAQRHTTPTRVALIFAM